MFPEAQLLYPTVTSTLYRQAGETRMKLISTLIAHRIKAALNGTTLSALLMALSICLVPAGPAAAANYVVNVSTDQPDANTAVAACDIGVATGNCSLRAAIQQGNNVAGNHTITFTVPTVTVVNGSLPTLAAPFTITGNVGFTTINGNGNGCLSLTDSGTPALGHATGATGSSITNLAIINCNGDGISANGHNYTFSNNRIGVDATGLLAAPNSGHGISVSASQVYPDTSTGFLSSTYANFPVHPVDASQINAFQSNLATALANLQPITISGNVISGNTQNGIFIFSQNLAAVNVRNNMIGTDFTGNLAIGNGGAGIRFTGSTFGNLIGPNNVISGNLGDGINVDSGDVFLPNFIMGNRIGLSSTNAGNHIGNGLNGISTNTKPSTDPTKFNPAMTSIIIGPANLISDNKGGSNSLDPDVMGNDNAGIVITGASTSVKVIGNTVGMGEFPPGTPLASKAYGNAGDGIIVTTSGNSIGGTSAGSGNNIAANVRHGIVVKGSSTASNKIIGNSIGTHALLAGNLSVGNGYDGIHIDAANSTSIGGAGATDFNLIAGNGRNGTKVRNGGTANGWSNLLQRNRIYSNAKAFAGVGIDLDHQENATDAAHVEIPTNYANLDQNPARICTGPADTGACAGSAAPASTGGNTTLSWTVSTHGPASFRAEFFQINAADPNSATSMTFLGEQLFSTNLGLGVTPADSAACSAGRCSASVAGNTVGSYVVMTVSDITPLTDQPGGGGDWKSNLICFIGDLGVILSSCNVNNTSEFSNTVTVPFSNNANLSALVVSSGTLVPAFASATLSYTDAVANAVSSMTVTPTVANATATVKVNGTTVASGAASGAIALVVGANPISIAVTAQDGTTIQTYTVTVTRAAAVSNNANLSALTLSAGTLVPVFASASLNYTDAVANAVASITVTPTVADATATVKVNGTTVTSGSASGSIALVVGANPISIAVTAQDGTTIQTYIVTVTRAAALSSNANLSALVVSAGTLVPAFASATLNYNDAVANAVASITVTPTVADATATVKVNGTTVTSGSASGAIALVVGANPISVAVTAQDGTTIQTYTINVNRAGALSNNANLSALTVSAGSLVPAFASATLAYADSVANAVSSITVTSTVADATATVKVNGTTVVSGSASGAIALVVGANPISIAVTAQDGTTVQTYTVTVNRAGALSNNANLGALAISAGSLVPAFSSATLVYADAVANGVSTITVTPTVADATATVKVNGTAVASGSASAAIVLAVGANPITVVVTAQDGTTTQTYTVNVTRAGALSNNANLSALTVSAGSLVPAFASATLIYADAVANPVTSITVTPTVAQANATIKVNGNTVASGSASAAIALAVGANAISVVVTAQDGTTTQTYTVNVNRAAALSNNANLSALAVSTGSLVPAFASATLIYADAVANGVSSITVTPTVADATATVKVNGTTVASGSASAAIALAVGVNAITVAVTAQDGTTTQTYTVNVNRAGALSNNASLSVLTVSSGSLVPAFASATLIYADAVANAVASITVTPTAAQPNATITVNGTTVASGSASAAIALAVGANPITLVVTAQDGTTTQTYSVNVTRAAAALSNNANLSGLAISGGSLTPAFASATLAYSNAVANAVSSITVTPTVADATATVKVNGVTVASGSASAAIALAVGANTVTIVVTAQDGTTTQTYIVNVTRAAPVVTVFSGVTFTGTGTATATLSGGGSTCTFGTTAFVGPSVPAPAGVSFPDGLFDFTTTNCTGTITVTVTFPTAFAAGAQYWKYGPTPSLSSPHWYTLAAGAPNNLVLSGNTATFTITDGGLGDDDLTVNGTIVDRGGIGITAAVAATDPVTVPTLSLWSLLLLSGLMLVGFVGVTRVERRS